MTSDRPLKEQVKWFKGDMESPAEKSSMVLAQPTRVHKSAHQLPLKSKYKEVLTVLVGPGQESYTVHKDLICAKSAFFEAACNGNFIEGIQGIVRLPEDKPETFVLLLEWLYTERVAESDNADVVDWHEIASLYVLAEKLQILELKNAVVDTWIRKAEDTKEIPIHEVPYVYYNTPEGAPLRKLLINMVACDGEAESVRQAMDGLPWEFLMDLSVTLLKRKDLFMNTLSWNDPDLYHEFPTTTNDSEAEA